ncbi:MAG TPA: hypothetical protein VHB69_00405 [Mycobacteriales bacterium]|nr:hypothetical protein [Mycobacteriales bacterium]
MRLRAALIAASLVAPFGGLLETAQAAALAKPVVPADPVVLVGATAGHWRVVAHVDRHPERHVERPIDHPVPQRLHASCTRAATPASDRLGRYGEGIVSLTLAAPGTSWASSLDTSVDVDVAVDGGASQQVVLFQGSQPAVYQGFVGRMRTGQHCVSLAVDPRRSSDLATAKVDVFGISLGVVPRRSPAYLGLTHAPVMYGRSSSAERDAQLITDVTQSPDADGRDIDLSYTVIWTREDVGDGTVPAYEWGLWGRMTDIETVLQEVVAPSGRIVKAAYLSCGCEKLPLYPDALPAPPIGSEYDAAYPPSGTPKAMGHHLVLRDATGNNDVSPYKTSRYRFQQVPVMGPRDGQARDVVMDEHPWTYRISNDDVARTTVESADPRSLLAGGYPQYLVVDLDVTASAAQSIAVGVRLRGDPTWWTDDYAQTAGVPTTFPFYTGGHGRTVIKLPADWHSKRISALRIVLNGRPGGPTPKLVGKPAIQLVEVTPDYRVKRLRNPRLTVSTGTQLLPGLPI